MASNSSVYGLYAVRSALAGGAFIGIDLAVGGKSLDNDEWKRGGVSAASEFAANLGTGPIMDKLAAMDSLKSLAVDTYVRPALSGGIYVLADMALKVDGRSPMMEFLYQVGSSVISSYAAMPVAGALGVVEVRKS